MKTLSIILIALLSTSCLTVKRIEKHCSEFAKVCVTEIETKTDTIIKTKTVIRYRDTTLYIEMPGREIIKEVPVYIKEGIVESDLSVLVTPLARSNAQVVNSKLSHELIQVDTLILIKLQDALQTITIQEKQIETLKEKYVVTVKENKPLAKFTIKWFIESVILIVVGIFILFLKYQSKITGLFKK